MDWNKKFDSGVIVRLNAADIYEIIINNLLNEEVVELVHEICDCRADDYLDEMIIEDLGGELMQERPVL